MNIQLMNMVVTNTLNDGEDLKFEGGEQNESLFSDLMESELTKKEEVEEIKFLEGGQEIASFFMLTPYQFKTQTEEEVNHPNVDMISEEPKQTTTLFSNNSVELNDNSVKMNELLNQANISTQSGVDKRLFVELEQVGGNQLSLDSDVIKAIESSLSETTLVVANTQLVEENELFIKSHLSNREEQSVNEVDDLISSVIKDLGTEELKESDLNMLKAVNHRTILDKTTELTSKVGQDEINITSDVVVDNNGVFKKENSNPVESKEQPFLLNSYTAFTSPKTTSSDIQPLVSKTVSWENKAEFEELMIKHASLMNDGDKTTMVINLKPHTLGEMKISLEMKNGKLKALIQLEEFESKKIVEDSLKMLQRDLKNSIIEVEQMHSSSNFGKNYDENHHDKQENYPGEDNHHEQKEDEFEQLWSEMKHSNIEILV